MKKNLFKRILSVMLAAMMMSALVLSASAAEAPTITVPPATSAESEVPDAPKTPDTPVITEAPVPPNPTPIKIDNPAKPDNPKPQLILNIVTAPTGHGYLAWAMMVMSDVQITYDPGMDEYYLDFGLSPASKLAGLYNKYPYAFRATAYLEELAKLNDVHTAIWEKPDWRPKSIASQLSRKTVAALKAMDNDVDAYEALNFIKLRPEYRSNAELQEQVNYHLAVITATQNNLMKGLNQLKLEGTDWTMLSSAPTPADTIELAKDFLSKHTDLEVLHKVYGIAKNGPTSNALATFHAADADEIAELYAQVIAATEDYWQYDIELLENTRFAVPFPEGAVISWPNQETEPIVGEPPSSLLPTTSTGN